MFKLVKRVYIYIHGEAFYEKKLGRRFIFYNQKA